MPENAAATRTVVDQ